MDHVKHYVGIVLKLNFNNVMMVILVHLMDVINYVNYNQNLSLNNRHKLFVLLCFFLVLELLVYKR